MNREELVEEIRQIVSAGMGIVVEGGTDMVSRSLYRQRDRIVADIVAWLPRISQAIENGELKLPGEVGRGHGRVGEDFQFPDVRKGYNYPDFRWGWGRRLDRAAFSTEGAEPRDLDELEGQLIPFIALCPEGQGEEG